MLNYIKISNQIIKLTKLRYSFKKMILKLIQKLNINRNKT